MPDTLGHLRSDSIYMKYPEQRERKQIQRDRNQITSFQGNDWGSRE